MVTWNKYYPEFTSQEFDCRCGCGTNNMTEFHLDKLLLARKIAGIPFVIKSGSRCLEHNKEEGGAKNSDHLTGMGSDIFCDSSPNRWILLRALKAAGFTRIGVDKKFIHAGCNQENPQNVLWLY